MTVYVIDLESVPTRYTCEWKDHVPNLLKKEGLDVQIISGPQDIPQATTPGAFLNFGGTNVYKAVQVEQMGRLFCSGSVNHGDHFVFTDAWHPGIINLKYMSQLLGIPIKIHAFWHAGSYDKYDFLGRLVGDAPWVRHAEKSFFSAIDYNYFATEFHIRMFEQELLGRGECGEKINPSLMTVGKVFRTGWPMEYMPELLKPYENKPKRDLIVFPHRIAPEKQVEIFRDLASTMPQYEFVVCQDHSLTKQQYHEILSQAKIVFSASLQETLGIGCYEGALVGAVPLVPDRLSYQEMYYKDFTYPSIWTESWTSYQQNQNRLVARITSAMNHYAGTKDLLDRQVKYLSDYFFSAHAFLEQF